MTLTEYILQSGEGEPYYAIRMMCDLCDLEMYYNEVRNKRLISAAENGINICSICARKININFIKNL